MERIQHPTGSRHDPFIHRSDGCEVMIQNRSPHQLLLKTYKAGENSNDNPPLTLPRRRTNDRFRNEQFTLEHIQHTGLPRLQVPLFRRATNVTWLIPDESTQSKLPSPQSLHHEPSTVPPQHVTDLSHRFLHAFCHRQ